MVSEMLTRLNSEPIKYRTIVLLALDTGLRLGELLGLQWADIDFEKAVLSVYKANQALGGKGIYTKSPKNSSSVRQVAISDSVMTLLKKYRTWQAQKRFTMGDKWIDGDWIFTKKDGTPIYPDTPSHWFRKFLKKNNLPLIRFHSLRHLSATLLISLNVPLKNISSRLGHADIRTTANIYSAALESVDHQAADKMDAYLQRVVGADDKESPE